MPWVGAMMGRAAANKTRQLREVFERGVVYSTLVRLSAAVTLLAVTLIAVGGYISLSAQFTPWIAGLIVGGVVLVLALAVLLIVQHMTKTPRPSIIHPTTASEPEMPAPGKRQVDAITRIGEDIGASLSNGRVKTIDILIAALVAGTVLGASPALRHRVLQHRQRERKQEKPLS